MVMLTPGQIEELRAALESGRIRLIRKAKDAVEFSKDRDRDRVGRDSLDESVEEWMYATELRLADRENFLLTKIGSALQRIADETIDECEDCGESIGFKRLQARPVTTLCIVCKEDREQSER